MLSLVTKKKPEKKKKSLSVQQFYHSCPIHFPITTPFSHSLFFSIFFEASSSLSVALLLQFFFVGGFGIPIPFVCL
ncbi:hypothetical protein CK203_096280 [Vitis vinifera]|uniref:Uncharacterized protein n=1 Tax=Vitis vinifera TaxID=29760 RepID=A0A438FD46_VITVI|nr:hypothetical protein CK203_096280 [Vitis vinifera]